MSEHRRTRRPGPALLGAVVAALVLVAPAARAQITAIGPTGYDPIGAFEHAGFIWSSHLWILEQRRYDLRIVPEPTPGRVSAGVIEPFELRVTCVRQDLCQGTCACTCRLAAAVPGGGFCTTTIPGFYEGNTAHPHLFTSDGDRYSWAVRDADDPNGPPPYTAPMTFTNGPLRQPAVAEQIGPGVPPFPASPIPEVQGPSVAFFWEEAPGAFGYEVTLDRVGAPGTPCRKRLLDAVPGVTCDELVPGATYRWSVRAFNYLDPAQFPDITESCSLVTHDADDPERVGRCLGNVSTRSPHTFRVHSPCNGTCDDANPCTDDVCLPSGNCQNNCRWFANCPGCDARKCQFTTGGQCGCMPVQICGGGTFEMMQLAEARTLHLDPADATKTVRGAVSPPPGTSTLFKMVVLGNGPDTDVRVAVQASTGKYWTLASGATIRATASSVGASETFSLSASPFFSFLWLRASNGKYVTVATDGGALQATDTGGVMFMGTCTP
jgi:hypothetical protein